VRGRVLPATTPLACYVTNVPTAPAGAAPRRLADFLREQHGAILRRWEAAARQLAPARGLRGPVLLDHIPQFLEALSGFVQDAREDPATSPPEEFPRIHAVERLELGYDLADVVEEYSLLRTCIAEMAAEEHSPAVRSAELPRLHRAIDVAIALSVQRYEQAAAEHRGRLGAEITRERARAEETLAEAQHRAAELEAVIESIPDAVFIGDATGIKRTNRRALEQLGFDSPEALDRDISTLVDQIQTRHADTGQPMSVEEQVFTLALRGRTAVKEVVIKHLQTGQDVVVRSAAAPVRLGDEILGAVAINSDITERIRQERGLREALDLSERLGGVLAHDLRNPLGVIATSASLLQREGLELRHSRIVARISRNAERIERMIHDLLDYTRVQTGAGVPTNPRPMDLAETCRLVAEESELLFPGRDVEVRVSGDARGRWDPDRAYQAITNLVGNALRYGAEDAPVRIGVEGGEREVLVKVHNRGPAIPAELAGRIFEPFQRGESSASRSGGGLGLGLGLYIVRQIALAHRGTVEVTSSEEAGTTFTLRWPKRG
jgi:PAS domain S-box-containing protein